ncbi:MAG: long-subunit fatty acid transport protein [Verrucomicrobiales bacterium]|jgi:long-subunit fatty acid transport protein
MSNHWVHLLMGMLANTLFVVNGNALDMELAPADTSSLSATVGGVVGGGNDVTDFWGNMNQLRGVSASGSGGFDTIYGPGSGGSFFGNIDGLLNNTPGNPFGLPGIPVADPTPVVGSGKRSAVRMETLRSRSGGPLLAETPGVAAGAFEFEVETPIGPIPILVAPAGEKLSQQALATPEPRAFRPPSIFSAPLPVGSGARALGLAGAFSSVADDATAASWNPAGLTQLKAPEASFVYRHTRIKNRHTSNDPDFVVGDNDYESNGLNYLTISMPFRFDWFDYNLVFSLNYQEAYDFQNRFSAAIRDRDRQQFSRSNSRTFKDQQVDRFVFQEGSNLDLEVDIVSDIVTKSSSSLRQTIETELNADLQFKQQGVIDAISPAFAIELTPKFSLGAAFNFYQDSALAGRKIRSTTRSEWTATTDSRAQITSRQETSGTFTSTASVTFQGLGSFISAAPTVELTPTTGSFPTQVEQDTVSRRETRVVDGLFEETNAYSDLNGFNSTLGAWWVLGDKVAIGAAADLPWTADSKQKRTVHTKTTTFNRDRSRTLDSSESTQTESKRVEFEFPAYYAIGMSFIWMPHFHSSIDASYTTWSDFAFEAKGEGKINPFDGSPHGQNSIDDTWIVRTGTEYIIRLQRRKIRIPLRGGLIWEQRPALVKPDEYVGFSLGSGIEFGPEDSKTIIDIAYQFMRANDVQTIVPEQSSLSTDTEQHQIFISLLKYF